MSWMDAGACVSGTICFELMKGVPAGLVALAVAIPTIAISIRQYLLAKVKLKLDLFDKRYTIYRNLIGAYEQAIMGELDSRNPALSNPFNSFKAEATFLFGRDIEAYLDTATEKWTKMWMVKVTGEGSTMVPIDDVKERDKLVGWFIDETYKGAPQKFGRYMNFEKWH